MNEMTITSAKYVSDPVTGLTNADIEAVIDGQTYTVPLDPANRHYDEIMRQVEAGDLTIADAD